MSTLPGIVDAGPHDAELAADIISDAFEALDAATWLVADPGQRRDVLARDMLIWTEHALTYGMVNLADDLSAVAVWFPVVEPIPMPADYEERLDKACGEWADRFRALDTTFEANHPHGEAHHHLAFLAVRPGYQGSGVGTALLNHHHERYADMPAYLEASSLGSRRLYLRHGYTDAGEFRLPDGPPLWSMWRPAG
ncbi:MAG TPA: GNAT family N-acetyltransferase [Pseudonocardiaceae bacterium]|nr:GNAT family N-acetyltransferase [Pseudonocardiaceae bacterium]